MSTLIEDWITRFDARGLDYPPRSGKFHSLLLLLYSFSTLGTMLNLSLGGQFVLNCFICLSLSLYCNHLHFEQNFKIFYQICSMLLELYVHSIFTLAWKSMIFWMTLARFNDDFVEKLIWKHILSPSACWLLCFLLCNHSLFTIHIICLVKIKIWERPNSALLNWRLLCNLFVLWES